MQNRSFDNGRRIYQEGRQLVLNALLKVLKTGIVRDLKSGKELAKTRIKSRIPPPVLRHGLGRLLKA